jgi:hypothetical protein
MTTLAASPTISKAFYCTLYNDENHGVLGKVDGTIYFFADSGAITEFEPAMAPWLTLNGEVALAETARILDALHGAAWIATHRQMEVA